MLNLRASAGGDPYDRCLSDLVGGLRRRCRSWPRAATRRARFRRLQSAARSHGSSRLGRAHEIKEATEASRRGEPPRGWKRVPRPPAAQRLRVPVQRRRGPLIPPPGSGSMVCRHQGSTEGSPPVTQREGARAGRSGRSELVPCASESGLGGEPRSPGEASASSRGLRSVKSRPGRRAV